MKLTKSRLKQIIKEELTQLKEVWRGEEPDPREWSDPAPPHETGEEDPNPEETDKYERLNSLIRNVNSGLNTGADVDSDLAELEELKRELNMSQEFFTGYKTGLLASTDEGRY